jgi:hypothetical protein
MRALTLEHPIQGSWFRQLGDGGVAFITVGVSDNTITLRWCAPVSASRVERTSNSSSAAIKDVSVDHGRAHIPMAHQLLDGPDVVPAFQQVRRKAVTESMRGRGLGDAARRGSRSDGALDHALV